MRLYRAGSWASLESVICVYVQLLDGSAWTVLNVTACMSGYTEFYTRCTERVMSASHGFYSVSLVFSTESVVR